ncbi:MAG: lysophospholipid acyltransferase family protein [Opitutaceae bacterium]
MSGRKITPKQLKPHQRWMLSVAVLVFRLWSRTLRFELNGDVQKMVDNPLGPSVFIAWHNRLFLIPEFYRRYFRQRKLANIISASSDGGWLSALFEYFDVKAIRGSRYGRGAQAFRELLAANEDGYDIGVTPDGSRGPMYDMKPGAVAVAYKTGAPLILMSFNFGRAWRLKSWDRFYLPMPFTTIRVQAVSYGSASELGTEDPKVAAVMLKEQLDAITEDDLLDA